MYAGNDLSVCGTFRRLQMCVLLVMWVSSQVVALLSQDIFGPQYMIPSRFLPPKYNYYRPLPQSLRRTSSDAASDDPEIELTGRQHMGLRKRRLRERMGFERGRKGLIGHVYLIDFFVYVYTCGSRHVGRGERQLARVCHLL